MVFKETVLAIDLGPHWLLIWAATCFMGLHWLLKPHGQGPHGSGGPMAFSKGIALALDLGTPSCFRGLLAFDLGPQLAQGTQCLSKGPR